MKPQTPESVILDLDDEWVKSEISAASNSTTSFIAEEEAEEGGSGIESEEDEDEENRGEKMSEKFANCEKTEMSGLRKLHISGDEGPPAAEAPSQGRRKRGREGFRCNECPKSFRAPSVLKRHLASKHEIGSSKFLCLKCNFCTVRKDGMQGHMRSRHDEDGDESIKQVAYHKYKRTYPMRKKFKSFRERGGEKRIMSLQTKGNSFLGYRQKTSLMQERF